METITTLKMIEDRVAELQPLYDRMDKTSALVYLSDFKLRDAADTKDLERVINVTTNWPAVYANAIISDLMGAVWQTVIESDGKLSDKQKHVIETFIEDNLAQADEQLLQRGEAELFAWLCNHVCIRSLIGARWLTQLDKKGGYKIDCLPVDMRWTPFEFDKEGLSWAAPKHTRSKARIFSEYGKEITDEDAEVTDFWDRKKNEVWVGEELVKTRKNPFGYPPFVIIKPPSGFMLRDKGYIEHEAEDLLFMNRNLYKERSRSISIEQTLGMDVLHPPYEQEAEEAGVGDAAPKAGQTLKVKAGEKHALLPRGDITNAFRAGRSDIGRDLQMGGVNDIDLGTVSQQVSAVWITEQSEIRNKLIKPRLKALNAFRQQLGRMQISQYKIISEKGKGKGDIEIGVTGRKRKYSADQLGDPGTYTITNQLMSKSKKQEIVNLAMFQAARGELPLKLRLKDILMADDPDGIMRELDLEKARGADPAIALFEMAIRYAEEAEDLEGSEADVKRIESMMLTEQGCAIIRQRRMAPQPEEAGKAGEAEETKGPGMEKLMPMLGGGGPGRGGGRPRQPEEEE